MASESCPAKRSHDESSKEDIQQHSSELVYYANDDIALLSTPGQEVVIIAFKEDKIFLSSHSLVSEAMFSLPSPDNVESIRLSASGAFTGYSEGPSVFFLSAIYDPTTLP